MPTVHESANAKCIRESMRVCPPQSVARYAPLRSSHQFNAPAWPLNGTLITLLAYPSLHLSQPHSAHLPALPLLPRRTSPPMMEGALIHSRNAYTTTARKDVTPAATAENTATRSAHMVSP